MPSLGLGVSERRVMLAVVDVLLLNVSLLAVLVTRDLFSLSVEAIVSNVSYFAILTIVWMVWATFFDCYDLPRTANVRESVRSTGGAALLTTLAYLAIPHLTPHLPASRLTSLIFVLLGTAIVPAWRLCYLTIFSQPYFCRRVLVVGAGQSGQEIARLLNSNPEQQVSYSNSGYQMVGFVDDDTKRGTTVGGMPVLGTRHNLPQLVADKSVDLIVIAISHSQQIHPDLFRVLLACREQGIAIQQMTSLYEQLTGKVSVEYAGHDLSVVVPQSNSATHHAFSAIKRLLDLVWGLCGLAILFLALPFVAIANAIWSPGPLFYRQVRVGQGGKCFDLYKLRSMIPAAEEGCGAVWACQGDNRITPVGKLLRRSRLDELPQFWNVLKGDMSLVGPRPERPEFLEQLAEQVPFYQARHAVRPGITGWAQVRYRYGSSVDDARIKLEYDLYYIKRQSAFLELAILLKTVPVMLGLQGT
jgi:exopolysaccharide biosynthesis polyprenyl glycosylphosphotransferase